MKIIEGINWVFSGTPEFDRTVAFFRDVMGLSVKEAGVPVTDTQFTRYALFALPQGGTLEILEPKEHVQELYSALMLSLTVEDVVQARRELEGKGVEFVSPLFKAQDGVGWTYFRAPDGHVYQLAGAYHEE
jgi:catechol 2,3-dioxygenase-like lactoylglutathione lyase family enzyme